MLHAGPAKASSLEAHCMRAIMLWEQLLRACFVGVPKFVFQRFRSTDKVVSFFFVYVMLQALALLWAFLGNVATVLGENMMSIITMPVQQACCVLLLHAAVIAIIVAFGRAMWILTWQSTDNFPLIRRMVAHECRPQAVILTIAMPMLVILPSLMVVPFLCVDDDSNSGDIEVPQWRRSLCEDSYMRFISNKHPVFHRSLRLATAIAICQFIQTCLEVLPQWRVALSGISRRSTLGLGFSLALLGVGGCLWWIEWIARHFQYQITPLSHLPAPEWELYGMGLLCFWIVWYMALTITTLPNVTECQADQRRLSGLFERLKYTFVFGQAIVFVRACVHPQMGFVHAQLELTTINVLLPSIYVFSLISLRLVTLSNMRSVAVSLPLSLVGATLIFRASKMEHKPHAFVVLVIFLFVLGLRFTETPQSLKSGSRVTVSLWQMLHKPSPTSKSAAKSHRAVKKLVTIAVTVSLLLIVAMSGFSILSVMQQNAKWYPDATSVHFHAPDALSVHHTSAVKLHLGMVNATNTPMHKDRPEYASCGHQWHGLTLVDYGLIAQAAYFDPLSQDIPHFISTVFPDLPIEVRFPLFNTKTGGKSDFYEAYIPSLNVSVISVRGTDIWRFTDFVEDVKMFIEPVTFTILSTVFPTIRIWPDVTFSTLIQLYHELIALLGLQHEFWYYHELLQYVSSIEDREVVLTGHSLGGGIARVVGTFLDKTSVTFSPPGFVQGYSKLVHEIGGKTLKVDRQKVHHMSVAVIPEYDPITMVDTQSGLLQKISCDTAHLSMQLSCHMIEGSLCNLLEHCGDTRARIASCAFEHQITEITDDLVVLVASIVSVESIVPLLILTIMVLSVAIRSRRPSQSHQPPPPIIVNSPRPNAPVPPPTVRRARKRTPSRRRQSVA